MKNITFKIHKTHTHCDLKSSFPKDPFFFFGNYYDYLERTQSNLSYHGALL